MQDETITEANAAEVFRQLSALLPAQGSNSTSAITQGESWWTPGEIAAGRLASIKAFMRRGFKLVEGMLKKGPHSARPTFIPQYPRPGDKGYDERVHSFAVRMGGEWIRPNRFRYQGQHVIDAWGYFCDPDECSICGSTHGELRFQVAIRQTSVRGQPQPHAWTYCPRCCTPEEVAMWKEGASKQAEKTRR